MVAAWRTVGAEVVVDPGGRWLIGPGTKRREASAELYVANSGTTIRFLTAALCSLPGGRFRLYGVPRMHRRPIGPLVDALRQLGAMIQYEADEGYPPLVIEAGGLRGGTVRLDGTASSQFASALLMASTRAEEPVRLEITGPLVSAPFVELTVQMMRQFGASVTATWQVPPQQCQDVPRGRVVAVFEVAPGLPGREQYEVEPDATAASYFWAAAALTGGDVLVEGLRRRDALQGDVAFVDVLRTMGAQVVDEESGIRVVGGELHGVDVNLSAISDTTPTLAVLAPFACGQTRIRGVEHIRWQETDRVRAIATELSRIGAVVEEHEDGLTVQGGGRLHAATIQTYRDHRIAMAFALVGLRVPGIQIADPACTVKTYPGYWSDLLALLADH